MRDRPCLVRVPCAPVTDALDTDAPSDPGTEQPALTRGVIAGVISGVLLLVASRANRSWDLLNADELDQFKTLVALAAPALAGWLISRHVVPAGKADRAANFFMNAGYAQGLEDKQAEIHSFLTAPQAQGAGLKDLGGFAAESTDPGPSDVVSEGLSGAQRDADVSLLVDEGFLAYISPIKTSP